MRTVHYVVVKNKNMGSSRFLCYNDVAGEWFLSEVPEQYTPLNAETIFSNLPIVLDYSAIVMIVEREFPDDVFSPFKIIKQREVAAGEPVQFYRDVW